MEPAKLSALVRGELDWIAMRCLEKDRARRYDTASALARDKRVQVAGSAEQVKQHHRLYPAGERLRTCGPKGRD
jgi:non-specific serine/threonine protein kinase/serine/threonine-protein kinase